MVAKAKKHFTVTRVAATLDDKESWVEGGRKVHHVRSDANTVGFEITSGNDRLDGLVEGRIFEHEITARAVAAVGNFIYGLRRRGRVAEEVGAAAAAAAVMHEAGAQVVDADLVSVAHGAAE